MDPPLLAYRMVGISGKVATIFLKIGWQLVQYSGRNAMNEAYANA